MLVEAPRYGLLGLECCGAFQNPRAGCQCLGIRHSAPPRYLIYDLFGNIWLIKINLKSGIGATATHYSESI